MTSFYTVGLLILSNSFMTVAWYGHLKSQEFSWMNKFGMAGIILFSWGIAFFEYALQVPANRIGYNKFGGAFSLVELKIIQEVISISIFLLFTILVFRDESIKWNHYIAFIFIILAAYFAFKK